MRRRALALVLLLGAPALFAATQGPGDPKLPRDTVRGKLVLQDGKAPAADQPIYLKTEDGRSLRIEGDSLVEAVLRDPQLAERLWEIRGNVQPDGSIDTQRLFTVKDGKLFRVTYYCEICNITTYEPGRCMCCQGPTELKELPAEP